MKELTKEKLIELIQEISRKAGTTTVPRHEFLRETGLSERQVLKLFGSYNALVQAAGLEPMTFPTSGERVYSDMELLEEIIRVLRLPSSKLTRIFFEMNASVSPSVCERRFGGWLNALKSAMNLLDPVLDRELIARIEEYTLPVLSERKPVSAAPRQSDTEELQESLATPPMQLKSESIPYNGSNVYGDFINFRGLQHAPVNEQGVVLLFGMICREIGYVVESVRSGFPDCEAKRQIPGKVGKWQRVRIEFEHQSRTFQVHGHDPNLCDVIVCWEDNWPDCPLEVLELRSILEKLSSSV